MVANAVEKAMVPYFAQIMEHLKVYLTGQLAPEEMALQTQALGNNNNYYYIYKTLLITLLFTFFSYVALRHFGCHCSDDR